MPEGESRGGGRGSRGGVKVKAAGGGTIRERRGGGGGREGVLEGKGEEGGRRWDSMQLRGSAGDCRPADRHPARTAC